MFVVVVGEQVFNAFEARARGGAEAFDEFVFVVEQGEIGAEFRNDVSI